MSSFITLSDLGMAYRKAKVDMYYSTSSSFFEIAKYEDNLYENLNNLLEKIRGKERSWIKEKDFIGSWTLVPKKMHCEEDEDKAMNIIHTSPWEKWKYFKDQQAEFRLMAKVSIDFHVLSSLWISKVGCKYDNMLSEKSYGNRLRRKKNREFNIFSLGNFNPYLYRFKLWQNDAMMAIQKAIKENKKIVILTADVSYFYHNLNPEFMRRDKFHDAMNADLEDQEVHFSLDEHESWLNDLFIDSIEKWARKTPLKRGLPVGVPASAIVANMALFDFDKIIEKEVIPLHYGRYVDDIILVFENTSEFKSKKQVWEWLFSRSREKLSWEYEENSQIKKENNIIFNPKYLDNSKITFSNEKNKIFLLDENYEKEFLDSIFREMRKQSSEWRMLPNLPENVDHVATNIVSATKNNGESANNLREVDAMTMRRANFALQLRDFEAYERDLHPLAWTKYRYAFFEGFIKYILVLPEFFDLAIYFPRVIRMATACEDFKYLYEMIKAIERLYEAVKNIDNSQSILCDKTLLNDKAVSIWKEEVNRSIIENIAASFPAKLSKEGKKSWKKYFSTVFFSQKLQAKKNNFINIFLNSSCKDIWDKKTSFENAAICFQKKQERLFSYDLAHAPFRFLGLPKNMIPSRELPKKKSITYYDKFDSSMKNNILKGLQILTKWLMLEKSNSIPNAIIFPTRPYNMNELYFLKKEPYKEKFSREICEIIFSLRGYSMIGKLPFLDKKYGLAIQKDRKEKRIKIALASWKTNEKSWKASVIQSTDPDIHRYQRLTGLLNGFLHSSKKSYYFIMPELSLPAHWFFRIAKKFHNLDISLIAGVEYLHGKRRTVRNQIWASLPYDGFGFPSMFVFRQDKQQAAFHEEKELKRLANLKLRPEIPWREPPFIMHGDFHFALLICSELTNISYRESLRGKIDALFVPEWNKDTETFNSLVESSALDMHAYIIQCNDRQYGDSRIRTPYKDSWKHDLIRIKGGKEDYVVVGEIDIASLRAFQSGYRSPSGPFKPVPDGFKISHKRKTLPLDDKGS